MQVLKEEIRNKIAHCALLEFYKNGYKGASMRAISSAAGVSLGNLYHYFPGKAKLFATLMTPAYKEAKDLIDLTGQGEESLAVLKKMATDTLPRLLAQRKPLVILMEKSQETPFEKTKAELIQAVALRLERDIVTSKSFSHVLAASLVEGILLILHALEDEQQARDELMALFRFYFYRWQERIS